MVIILYPPIGLGMLSQDEFVGQDVVEIPLKGFTLELTSQLFAFGNVPNVHFEQIGSVHVKQLFIIVHPDFDYASRVDTVRIFIAGESVRVERAENMSHSRTRDCLQTTTTHPDTK